ncbi:hypothetical protein [Candidatus Aquicultor sp.]
MDFPLIPSRSSHHPFREKTDLVRQPSPESSPIAQAASAQALLIKGYSSVGNSRFIDVEFQEIVDQTDLSNQFPHPPDFRLKNAFSQYHNLARRKPQKQHTIDLYA